MISLLRYEHKHKPHDMFEYGLVKVYDPKGRLAGVVTYFEKGLNEIDFTTTIYGCVVSVMAAYDLLYEQTERGYSVKSCFDISDYRVIEEAHEKKVRRLRSV